MFKKIFLFLLFSLSAISFGATVLGYFARWVNFAEFLVSFRPLLCLVGLGLTLFSLRSKHRFRLALALSVFILNGIEIAPYLLPHGRADEQNFSVLFYNVDRAQMEYVGPAAVIDLVESTPADLVVLREVGVKPAEQLLDQFESQFPYSLAYQHSSNDGVLIFSHVPLNEPEITQLGGGRQVALADLTIQCQQVHLVAPHPTNPYMGIQSRNQQLDAIADYVDQTQEPMLVVGDLNVTMWSGWYKQIERAGVRNVRLGHGIHPTWRVPGFAFQIPFIYFPIDHILISEEIKTFSIDRLPWLGSDHRPIMAQLEMPNSCAT